MGERLKQNNVTGSVASFDTDWAKPLDSLKVSIEPVQSGSGDPSPTNVRPISGWTGANVNANGTTIPITFPTEAGTVYGGTLDVTKGTLTVDRVNKTLAPNDIRLVGTTTTSINYASTFDLEDMADDTAVLSSSYRSYQGPSNLCVRGVGTHITIYNNDFVDLETAQTMLEGVQLVYELATPQIYSLTPTEITALLGANTIYADCGSVDASYFSRDYVPVASDTGLITITDGIEAPIDSLKVYFDPVQEGTGDPSPDNVRAITGWTGVDVIQAGKNLFDESHAEAKWVNNSNAIIDSQASRIVKISVAAGQQISASNSSATSASNALLIAFFNKDNTVISRNVLTSGAYGFTQTAPANTAYAYAGFLSTYFTSDMQVEIASTTTAYAPYAATTYPITFPAEVGTVYGGYVDVVKGELVVDRAMVDLGTLNFTKDNAGYYQTTSSETSVNDAVHYTSAQKANIMCPKYKPYPVGQITQTNYAIGIYWYSSGNRNILRIKDDDYYAVATAQEFKEAMSGVIAVYPIATPVTYTLTPTQLSTFKGINNIYSNANGAAEMMYYSPVKESILDVRRGVIMGAPHIESISGGVASFNTNMAAKLKNLAVNIEAVQSGSGDPSPDNVRVISGWTGCNITKCGKNLFDQTIMKDQAAWNTIKFYAPVGATLTMSTNEPNPGGSGLLVYLRLPNESQSNSNKVYSGHSVTRTVTDTGYVEVLQRRASGEESFQNYQFQIEVGSTATEFESYNSSTANIDWTDTAGTVYGGTLDVTTGLLTVDRAMVDLGTLTWTKVAPDTGTKNYFYATPSPQAKGKPITEVTNSICSQYAPKAYGPICGGNPVNGHFIAETTHLVYIHDDNLANGDAAAFKTAMSGVQLVYELATPQTYQLTPTQVKTLLGNNTIYADTGDVELTYWKH